MGGAKSHTVRLFSGSTLNISLPVPVFLSLATTQGSSIIGTKPNGNSPKVVGGIISAGGIIVSSGKSLTFGSFIEGGFNSTI